MPFDLSMGEISVILFVALLVFGGKLPEMARRFGSALSEFKRGMREELRKVEDGERSGGGQPPAFTGKTKITQKGLQHTIDRHGPNSTVPFKSRFAAGENIESLVRGVDEMPAVYQPATGNYVRTYDAGRAIAIARTTGGPTSTVTVIVRQDGTLVTAFPGTPVGGTSMALDLVVERRKHEPIEAVSVDVEVYGELMSAVMPLQPRAFLHLADYYEDAEIPVDELKDLAEEAGRVLLSASASAKVKDVARRIQRLAKTAIGEGLPVRAYSD